MSDETDRAAKELLNDARLVALAAAIQKTHQTQRETIIALLESMRGHKSEALDSADRALDYLLASQGELEKVLASLQASPNMEEAIKAIRRG